MNKSQCNGSRIAAVALAAILALPATAAAQVVPVFGGVYGGVGGIYTDFDDLEEDSRYGYRIYAGFDVLRIPAVARFGFEGGYTRSGTFETGLVENGSERIENGDVGFQATLTTIPVINLHARAGYEWGDTSGAKYAVGASASVFPLLRIRAEYQLRNDFDAALLGLELRIP